MRQRAPDGTGGGSIGRTAGGAEDDASVNGVPAFKFPAPISSTGKRTTTGLMPAVGGSPSVSVTSEVSTPGADGELAPPRRRRAGSLFFPHAVPVIEDRQHRHGRSRSRNRSRGGKGGVSSHGGSANSIHSFHPSEDASVAAEPEEEMTPYPSRLPSKRMEQRQRHKQRRLQRQMSRRGRRSGSRSPADSDGNGDGDGDGDGSGRGRNILDDIDSSLLSGTAQSTTRSARDTSYSSSSSSSGSSSSSSSSSSDDDDYLVPMALVVGHDNAIGKDRTVVLHERSLGVLPPTSMLRQRLTMLVFNQYFEAVVMVLILTSSVLLALEHPRLDSDSGLANFLRIADITLVVVFATEMTLKIVAMGLYAHEGAYLRSQWNVLDCFVVFVGILSLALDGRIQFLRSLRALRPLRLVSRNPAMRIVVNSLVRAIPSMFNVVLVCFLFWLIFGILGVQLFAGKFYSCDLRTVANRAECLAAGGTWTNSDRTFDNVMFAMLYLFEVATLEMWPDLMYQAVDAVGVDQQPRRDHSPLIGLYFVAFIIVVSFFALNLFVGVVIDNFNEIKKIYNGSVFLTQDQQNWLEAQKKMLKARPSVLPPCPTSPVRRAAFKLVMDRRFDLVIMAIICLNITFMAAEHFGQPASLTTALKIANKTFISIFVLEALLKIAALGPRHYFASAWNRFDSFIVVISLPDLFGVEIGIGATVLRVFRVFRIFKLVKTAKGLRVLFRTLLYSLPTLWNVGSILIMLFFIYAVAGVSAFGLVSKGNFLTDQANFDHFGIAMLTLFRCATGESWNGIMRDIMNNDGGTKAAWVYFVSFMIIIFFVLVNLFIAVILENFADISEDSSAGDDALTSASYDNYAEVWSTYDPRRSLYIPSSSIPAFLRDLDPPLGLGPGSTLREANMMVLQLHSLPDYGGRVHFSKLLLALADARIGVPLPNTLDVEAEVARSWSRIFRAPEVEDSAFSSIAEHHAARFVQRHWREFATRRKLERAKGKARTGDAYSRITAELPPLMLSEGGGEP
jgi:hypothetical protein